MSWNPLKLRRFFTRQKPRVIGRFGRTLRWTLRVFLLLLAIDVFYLAHIWPDWSALGHGKVPRSLFMQRYQDQRKQDRRLPVLQWQPVSLRAIPRHVRHAAIAAEDARFYSHSGIDLQAFWEAMESNLDRMEFRYGGSTISQQTVKNLFLSPSRNPLRKWHELILTVAMELKLRKSRILEIYLNVAEFGEGIYGVEAAAWHYWRKPVSELSPWEAAQLAACLPSPKKDNPQTQTRRFLNRSQKVYGFLRHWLEEYPPG